MILQADLWMKLEKFTVNLPERHLVAAGMLTFQLGKQSTLAGVMRDLQPSDSAA